MKVLLDTHAIAWWLLDDQRLSRKAHSIITDPDNQIWVSSISAFEIATTFRIGKWPDIGDLARNFETAIRSENFVLLPVTAAHGTRGGLLEGHRRDPFDRLLAAQSLGEQLPLVTFDPVFKAFGVETVW